MGYEFSEINYACDCVRPMIEKIKEKNEKLKDVDLELELFDLFTGKSVSTLVYKVGKSNKRLYVNHEYCPFCGKKLVGLGEKRSE